MRDTSHRSPIIVGLAAYAALSAICFSAGSIPSLLTLAQSNQRLLWLLGPPALLLYGTELLWLYAAGSIAVALLAWGTGRATRRWSVWSIALGVLALVAWLGLGLLVYVPAW